tara:strand:+ start:2060 stop:2314 length:255 start_codon:yes stop_codon:yes gene_type:complete
MSVIYSKGYLYLIKLSATDRILNKCYGKKVGDEIRLKNERMRKRELDDLHYQIRKEIMETRREEIYRKKKDKEIERIYNEFIRD